MPHKTNSYYVGVAEPVARTSWADFQHELDFPGTGLEVEFVRDSAARTRLDMRTGGAPDVARTDEVARRFRLFLEGRGLIDATSGPRR
jgi:hypothetical protein